MGIKLLMHFDGADGSTTFTDSSHEEHGDATVTGTAQVDTSVKKWGTGSLLLNGNGDYITYGDHSDWDIFASAVGDVTVDFWIYPTQKDSWQYIFQHLEDPNNHWAIRINDDNILQVESREAATNEIAVDSVATITINQWQHIAVIKIANEIGVYLDGPQVAYGALQTINNTGYLNIGAQYHADVFKNFFGGNIEEIRIIDSNSFGAAPDVGLTDTITVPTSAYSVGEDIGVRVRTGSLTANIAFTSDVTSGNPLRISKNGTTYGAVLVDINDSSATGFRIYDGSIVKALSSVS